MRRLMLTFLLATSAAMPAVAQENQGRDPDRDERQQAREERRAVRAERAAEQQAGRQPEVQQQQQAIEPRQAERQRGEGGNREQRRFERGGWEQRGSDGRRAYRDPQRQSYGAPYAENGQVLSEQRDISRVRNRSILGQVMEQERQGQVAVHRDRDGRRGRHGGYHRDVNREHRELHAGDPTRREHRGWHRDVTRQHDRRHWAWDNSWRNNRSYDWRGYRGRYGSLYNLSNYYDPYRYGYRRFSIGVSLWPSYYSSRYWLNDPWQYRLPPAYGPYRWVRYYDDALLVNIYTGQVVDVEHNFFW